MSMNAKAPTLASFLIKQNAKIFRETMNVGATMVSSLTKTEFVGTWTNAIGHRVISQPPSASINKEALSAWTYQPLVVVHF